MKEANKFREPRKVDLIEESQRGLLLSQIERCRIARIGRLSELQQIGGAKGNILGIVDEEAKKLQKEQFPEEVSILIDLLPEEAQKDLEKKTWKQTGAIQKELERNGKDYAKKIFGKTIRVIYQNNLLSEQKKTVELGKEE